MPPYGEPDWATPGAPASATTMTPGTAAPASASNGNSGESRAKAQCLIVLLSFVNIGLACLMGALGILSLIKFRPGMSLTIAFLSTYMVVFAALLFLYEVIYWQPFGGLNKTFRKNFGFLYGLRGKGFYLVFIAFLCLGLKDESNVSGVRGLDWATGISWLAAGCLHVFIGCTWPEANQSYKPPTGYSGNEPDPSVV